MDRGHVLPISKLKVLAAGLLKFQLLMELDALTMDLFAPNTVIILVGPLEESNIIFSGFVSWQDESLSPS